MGLVNDGKNLMLTGFTGSVRYVSLHTGDPSTNGANEVAGGSYARKTVAWAAAASGSVSSASVIVFDVPGSNTITYLGYWSAVTAGTFYGSRALDTSQSFATAGTYTIATGNLTESLS